jgi:hypothetical protein
LEDVKGAVNKMALLVAEKEALEAVAMQLAAERDEAMGEVCTLENRNSLIVFPFDSLLVGSKGLKTCLCSFLNLFFHSS